MPQPTRTLVCYRVFSEQLYAYVIQLDAEEYLVPQDDQDRLFVPSMVNYTLACIATDTTPRIKSPNTGKITKRKTWNITGVRIFLPTGRMFPLDSLYRVKIKFTGVKSGFKTLYFTRLFLQDWRLVTFIECIWLNQLKKKNGDLNSCSFFIRKKFWTLAISKKKISSDEKCCTGSSNGSKVHTTLQLQIHRNSLSNGLVNLNSYERPIIAARISYLEVCWNLSSSVSWRNGIFSMLFHVFFVRPHGYHW